MVRARDSGEVSSNVGEKVNSFRDVLKFRHLVSGAHFLHVFQAVELRNVNVLGSGGVNLLATSRHIRRPLISLYFNTVLFTSLVLNVSLYIVHVPQLC